MKSKYFPLTGINTDFGPAVLRRYIRGGLPARLGREAYVFTGYERSRPFREFEVLRRMTGHGLPVPAPIAASCERNWLTYKGGLLMEQIEGARTLAELMEASNADAEVWSEVGKCVRRFHNAGVEHADLNARNILIDERDGKVSLLDFDRCTFNPGQQVNGQRNLARLKRSLEKFWPEVPGSPINACWTILMAGYHD